jgi:vitamin K-dependent gamma-carboxylase
MIEPALRRAFEPIDAAWLAALRVLFGLAMAFSTLRFIAYGWIDRFFVAPAFHFKYWGFTWVEPLSGAGMHQLFWALTALALCVALGLCFRLSALLFALGFAYLQLIDVTTYLNHYYLAALLALLLALSPAGRAYSIDAWLRPSLAQRSVPAGVLWLFRFQVGLVYTCAGLAKATPDWLLHAQPLRIWLNARGDLPLLGPLLTQPFAAPLMSWAGFLFDATIAWWLLARRTRPWAFAAVIAFHVLTRALFPIGMFPVIMVLAALVFFSPSWPRVALGWLARLAGMGLVPALASTPVAIDRDASRLLPQARAGAASGGQRVLAGIALAYCALQLALPLRTFAYGPGVSWHEQGMRWSWRVMVREKNGSVTFIVRDKRTGRSLHVAPRRYLTALQEREMAGQPDLILQLAHHIHADFTARLRGDVEVRVDALVSLNGRRMRALIDPNVDLSAVRDGLAPASWITAAPAEPPPRIRPI